MARDPIHGSRTPQKTDSYLSTVVNGAVELLDIFVSFERSFGSVTTLLTDVTSVTSVSLAVLSASGLHIVIRYRNSIQIVVKWG